MIGGNTMVYDSNTIINLIILAVTMILFPVLGWWLARLIRDKDSLTAKNLELWQAGAKERHEGLVNQLTNLDVCMNSVKKTVNGKVDITDCMRLSAEKWERINKHGHDGKGNVIILR